MVCSVEGLEAEYEFLPQSGEYKCLITLRSENKRLELKEAFAGDGYAQYLFLNKPAPGRANRWEARTSLVGKTGVRWSSTKFDSGGETIQVALGEQSPLFPCSGFVRGDLQGTVRAPALQLKMMRKDIWAFFLYFEDSDRYDGYEIRCESESLAVARGSASATAEITVEGGSPPSILASLKSEGSDQRRIALVLDRAIGGGSQQDSIQQELAVFTKGEDGYKEARWVPVNRSGLEVLWIFSSESLSQRGPLKDLLEAVGAKVNRSVLAGFSDYAGGREMDDFVIADDPSMFYQIGVMLEDAKSEASDWAALEFVKTTS